MALRGFPYVVNHITGEHNDWADLLFRWGVLPRPEVSVARRARVRFPAEGAPVLYDYIKDDIPPQQETWPTIEEFLEAQRVAQANGGVAPPGLIAGADSLHRTQKDAVWVPDLPYKCDCSSLHTPCQQDTVAPE